MPASWKITYPSTADGCLKHMPWGCLLWVMSSLVSACATHPSAPANSSGPIISNVVNSPFLDLDGRPIGNLRAVPQPTPAKGHENAATADHPGSALLR